MVDALRCVQCDEPIQPRVTQSGRPKRFCSPRCGARWRRTHEAELTAKRRDPFIQAWCEQCGKQLRGRQSRWCGYSCKTLVARARAKTHFGNLITDETIETAKAKFPSLTRDWDADMVSACADRMMPILTRRLLKLNDQIPGHIPNYVRRELGQDAPDGQRGRRPSVSGPQSV